MSLERNKPVTVIAVCYNHARFLIECLESIRMQTFQDFQLIITDDFSNDESPSLIEGWITQNRPDAIFIRHEKNVGLCRTLNEALGCASGEFISMTATDDVWENDKIEKQLAVMREQSDQVALIYSDARQMDEAGNILPEKFIEAHKGDFSPPSGNVFSALVDGNFVPAMSTLIRRKAIEAVGNYDERLSYEDYDMWLRLSQKYDFVFFPGVFARYRIVSTSIVRTLFNEPTAHHSHTLFLINTKLLLTELLNDRQRNACSEKQWEAAYTLYLLGDSKACACLWKAFYSTKKSRVFLLAVVSCFGLSRQRAKKLMSYVKK